MGTRTIHAKLGTMPSGYYQVKNSANPDPLHEGTVIWIRPDGAAYHGYRWETAWVDRVDEVGGKPFYFLSRW